LRTASKGPCHFSRLFALLAVLIDHLLIERDGLVGDRRPRELLFHATAAAPRYQVGASGGSPFLEVYREKLAIGSLYLIARARVTSGTEVPSWAEQSHAG